MLRHHCIALEPGPKIKVPFVLSCTDLKNITCTLTECWQDKSYMHDIFTVYQFIGLLNLVWFLILPALVWFLQTGYKWADCIVLFVCSLSTNCQWKKVCDLWKKLNKFQNYNNQTYHMTSAYLFHIDLNMTLIVMNKEWPKTDIKA